MDYKLDLTFTVAVVPNQLTLDGELQAINWGYLTLDHCKLYLN